MQNYNYPNGVVNTSTSYSNLDAYGNNGVVNGFAAPKLVSSVPTLFKLFKGKGHKFAQPVNNKNMKNDYVQYLKSNQLCKN